MKRYRIKLIDPEGRVPTTYLISAEKPFEWGARADAIVRADMGPVRHAIAEGLPPSLRAEIEEFEQKYRLKTVTNSGVCYRSAKGEWTSFVTPAIFDTPKDAEQAAIGEETEYEIEPFEEECGAVAKEERDGFEHDDLPPAAQAGSKFAIDQAVLFKGAPRTVLDVFQRWADRVFFYQLDTGETAQESDLQEFKDGPFIPNLRDHFAGQALIAMISLRGRDDVDRFFPRHNTTFMDSVAQGAYAYADAMLRARKS